MELDNAPDASALSSLLEWLAQVPRPERCPRCGSPDIRIILYGYRGHGEDLDAAEEACKRKLAVGGGCIVDLDFPIWECGRCRLKGGRYADLLPPEEVAAQEAERERMRANASRLEKWLAKLLKQR